MECSVVRIYTGGHILSFTATKLRTIFPIILLLVCVLSDQKNRRGKQHTHSKLTESKSFHWEFVKIVVFYKGFSFFLMFST